MLDDVTALLLIAGNPDLSDDERLHALATLATFSPQEIPLALLTTLYYTDPGIRLYLISALAAFGPDARLDLLSLALDDADETLAEEAAHVLAQCHLKAAGEALLRVVHHDPHGRRYRAALRALGELRNASALPELLTALCDPVAASRAAAVYALGELGDSTALRQLMLHLQDTSWVVAETVFALAKLGAPSDLLVPCLQHPDPCVRASTVRALARYGPTAPYGAMHDLTSDAVAYMRHAARAALALLRT